MYVGLAWHFWNTRWRGTEAKRGLRAWERAAILAPLVLHGWLLYDGIFARELRFGFAQPLSVMTLLTLEQRLFRVIGAAFVCLTPTLITGIAFSETLFGRALRADHKTVFAVLSWLTFGLLLAGRVLYGWRGRTALRWTLSGFMMLL